MKKIIGITCLFLIGIWSYGQELKDDSRVDWSPEIYEVGKKYPGYVVTKDNDTIKGFIKAGKRFTATSVGISNQNRCEFYLQEADKKPTNNYKPKDIKGYAIADKVYESIAYSGGLMKTPNFNLVVIDGAIRVYEWYSKMEDSELVMVKKTDNGSEPKVCKVKTIIALGGEDPREDSYYLLKFSKKMSGLVEDNEELALNIKNKEKGYKFVSIYKIISEFNEWSDKK